MHTYISSNSINNLSQGQHQFHDSLCIVLTSLSCFSLSEFAHPTFLLLSVTTHLFLGKEKDIQHFNFGPTRPREALSMFFFSFPF